MKRILVVAQFTQLPGEAGNNRSRFRYICELLAESGYDVTEVTSRFRDLDKSQRKVNSDDFKDCPYKIELLEDPGYIKTVSLRRIYSQKVFAKNLVKWLEKQPPFDLVYCGAPPAEGMLVSGKYASRHNIPFIIDVQDLWPEAMRTIIDIPILSDLIFYPMKVQIDKAYSMADGIVAVSQTYLERAAKANRKNALQLVVYIGTDLERFDIESSKKLESVKKSSNEFWVTYAGSLNHSYDIETLIDAIKILKDRGLRNIKLIILGSGIKETKLRERASNLGIDAFFTGWVDYGTMAAYLKKSDILVNAIRKKAVQSITNKIGDYVAAGVPIINGSLNTEFRKMIEDWDIGYNYNPEDPKSMAEAIERIYKNPERHILMKKNARRLAEIKFNRKNTYPKIVEMVEKLIQKS